MLLTSTSQSALFYFPRLKDLKKKRQFTMAEHRYGKLIFCGQVSY